MHIEYDVQFRDPSIRKMRGTQEKMDTNSSKRAILCLRKAFFTMRATVGVDCPEFMQSTPLNVFETRLNKALSNLV